MSAEAGGSGGTGDKEDRKSKRTKYSDDDKKPSSGSGTSDAELASFHMFSEGDGGNPDDFIKQKNHILQLRKQHALQKSAKGASATMGWYYSHFFKHKLFDQDPVLETFDCLGFISSEVIGVSSESVRAIVLISVESVHFDRTGVFDS